MMNVPGDTERSDTERSDTERSAAVRRLAERLAEGLLPEITDDERDESPEVDQRSHLRWLTENRPPHHDR